MARKRDLSGEPGRPPKFLPQERQARRASTGDEVRSRILHPRFFHDPTLLGCSALARWFYLGLRTIADRTGHLEHDPARLGIQLLPMDGLVPAAEKLLRELAAAGAIRLCSTVGAIGIVDWNENVHPKEAPARFAEHVCAENKGLKSKSPRNYGTSREKVGRLEEEEEAEAEAFPSAPPAQDGGIGNSVADASSAPASTPTIATDPPAPAPHKTATKALIETRTRKDRSPRARELSPDEREVVEAISRASGASLRSSSPELRARLSEAGKGPLLLVVAYLGAHPDWAPGGKLNEHLDQVTPFRPGKWDSRLARATLWDQQGRPPISTGGNGADTVVAKNRASGAAWLARKEREDAAARANVIDIFPQRKELAHG